MCLYVSIVELTIDVHAFTLPWRPIRGGGGLLRFKRWSHFCCQGRSLTVCVCNTLSLRYSNVCLADFYSFDRSCSWVHVWPQRKLLKCWYVCIKTIQYKVSDVRQGETKAQHKETARTHQRLSFLQTPSDDNQANNKAICYWRQFIVTEPLPPPPTSLPAPNLCHSSKIQIL